MDSRATGSAYAAGYRALIVKSAIGHSQGACVARERLSGQTVQSRRSSRNDGKPPRLLVEACARAARKTHIAARKRAAALDALGDAGLVRIIASVGASRIPARTARVIVRQI